MLLVLFYMQAKFSNRPIAVLPFGVPTLVGFSVIKEPAKAGTPSFLCMSDGRFAVGVMFVLVVLVVVM